MANDSCLLNNELSKHRRLLNNVAENDGRLLNIATMHCSGKQPLFATTLLSKLPLFARVYFFVLLSVPRL